MPRISPERLGLRVHVGMGRGCGRLPGTPRQNTAVAETARTPLLTALEAEVQERGVGGAGFLWGLCLGLGASSSRSHIRVLPPLLLSPGHQPYRMRASPEHPCFNLSTAVKTSALRTLSFRGAGTQGFALGGFGEYSSATTNAKRSPLSARAIPVFKSTKVCLKNGHRENIPNACQSGPPLTLRGHVPVAE